MNRLPLDTYDDTPREMRRYLSHYGWHFNEKASKYAAKLMRRMDESSGRIRPITPFTKEDVDRILTNAGIKLENDVLYDSVYAANKCKADHWGGSVADELHLALYIKETVDDIDAADGALMRSWYAKTIANGDPVDWEEIL